MLSIADFKAKYETYSDEELYSIYKDADNYSGEARTALDMVISEKGGHEDLVKRLEEKAVIENEKTRIGNEAVKFGLEGVDASFLKNTTSSALLSQEEVNQIIETNVAMAEAIVEDKKVNTETIFKSILGCGLASIVGGAFASLQFLYFGATSTLMVIGTGLICYGVVKFITKKSFNNTAVIVSTIVAFMLSYLLAQLALAIFGYLG